ncbi:MAG TPA: phosphotransferase family protein [Dehalococcoidia bacterium]|nr:phosphotransferase family protein [Dehalococcoidia bacterium]
MTDDRRERPDRLAAELAAYLAAQVPAARDVVVKDVRPIPGGLSQEMYFFTAGWQDADHRTVERPYVLRRDPPPGEGVLETSRAREARLLRAVHATGLPVPDVPWFEGDPPFALGRPFLIMDRLPGDMVRDVPAVDVGSPRFRAIGRQMAEILGRLHALDVDHLQAATGLRPSESPSPTAAAAAQLDRHEAVLRRDQLEPQPVLTDVLLWLRRRLPPAPTLALVHADYRLSNLLLENDRVSGVLDWELAHIGDPMEDLGRLISRDRPLVSGLLPRDEFIAVYEAASGITVDLDACYFWEVVARLRAAITMLTGVKAYATSGYRHLHLGFMGLSHANRLYDLLGLIEDQ